MVEKVFVTRHVLLLMLTVALAGCSSNNNYEERHFFRSEYGTETHGRKNLLDRVVESDPGRIKVSISDDFETNAPERIAVLPFADHGSAQFVVDKIPLTFRDKEEREDWAWTYANRLRRALTGYLAQREFVPINLLQVDTILFDHGIDTYAKLQRVPPRQLGEWLGADAVVYGEVLHYEAYYAFLVSGYQVGMDARMVSTKDGHEYFSARGSRWAVQVLPAMSLEDIAINSAESLLQLRDVTLARAEEEVCREVVKRIPESKELRQRLILQARQRDQDNRMQAVAKAPSYGPASFVNTAYKPHPAPVIDGDGKHRLASGDMGSSQKQHSAVARRAFTPLAAHRTQLAHTTP